MTDTPPADDRPTVDKPAGYQEPLTPLTVTPKTARRVGLGVLSAAVLAVSAAFYFTSNAEAPPAGEQPPKTFTLKGTMDAPCYRPGYSDIHAGAQVEVRNEEDKLLKVGRLVEASGCHFTFDIGDVPAGHSQYGVHVGNAARGYVWKTEAEARAGVFLSLGD